MIGCAIDTLARILERKGYKPDEFGNAFRAAGVKQCDGSKGYVSLSDRAPKYVVLVQEETARNQWVRGRELQIPAGGAKVVYCTVSLYYEGYFDDSGRPLTGDAEASTVNGYLFI